MPLLRTEVVGKPNDGDVEPAHAIRVSRHTLLHHCIGNFLRFHSQDEHNASFYSIESRQPFGRTRLRVDGAKIQKIISPERAKNHTIIAEKYVKVSG
jgi:hypothetical protein